MSALTTGGESNEKLELSEKTNNDKPFKAGLIWHLVIILAYFQILAFYGLYLLFTSAKLATALFAYFLYRVGIVGITAGTHRLWSHRSYKAKWPLRLLLMVMFTSAFQYSILKWAKDHRVHHRFTDTDADPYNSRRGFWFSHFGWVYCQKHPDVVKYGKQIDFSDMINDPIVKFQDKYYLPLGILVAFVIPTIVPMYFWNETLANAFYIAVCLRWSVVSHTTGFVNSFAHMYGNKPYDKNSSSTNNVVISSLTAGEGWHNYHHAFPWDYKASELGRYFTNTTTGFIDFFAWVGWAYDLKTISPDLVQKRVLKTGDGTHPDGS